VQNQIILEELEDSVTEDLKWWCKFSADTAQQIGQHKCALPSKQNSQPNDYILSTILEQIYCYWKYYHNTIPSSTTIKTKKTDCINKM
jgi:hypothetical protein